MDKTPLDALVELVAQLKMLANDLHISWDEVMERVSNLGQPAPAE